MSASHAKIKRTSGKLNFTHVSSDSWWTCFRFCSLRTYGCSYGPDLFPLPLVRTLLLADGEALGQQCLCAGRETLERGQERQSPSSPRARLSLPSNGRMGITILEVTSGVVWERKYLLTFKLPGEEDPAKFRTQLSGLKNWVQISPCNFYIPPRAVPTRLLYYCCSSHLSHRPGSPRPKHTSSTVKLHSSDFQPTSLSSSLSPHIEGLWRRHPWHCNNQMKTIWLGLAG